MQLHYLKWERIISNSIRAGGLLFQMGGWGVQVDSSILNTKDKAKLLISKIKYVGRVYHIDSFVEVIVLM
jgi:hypothetical protein